MNYETLATYLGPKAQRPAKEGNTTILRLGPTCIGVMLHKTIIVQHYADGDCTIYTGGYRTVTTKRRINQYAPEGVKVHQRNHEWFVTGPISEYAEYPYFDGMDVSVI
jgi:hypothetical protein